MLRKGRLKLIRSNEARTKYKLIVKGDIPNRNSATNGNSEIHQLTLHENNIVQLMEEHSIGIFHIRSSIKWPDSDD
ncbi:protein of unknown function [Sterolibacterium denitrificans]|uniref:Uncharacterized protein n=1 Tax=Sterolibacterium denitrificans TaxID=157592 RepID=A0A7Z7HPI6_9PROT|nr:protein of unknown function [Sterolibacterium denitrificans]